MPDPRLVQPSADFFRIVVGRNQDGRASRFGKTGGQGSGQGIFVILVGGVPDGQVVRSRHLVAVRCRKQGRIHVQFPAGEGIGHVQQVLGRTVVVVQMMDPAGAARTETFERLQLRADERENGLLLIAQVDDARVVLLSKYINDSQLQWAQVLDFIDLNPTIVRNLVRVGFRMVIGHQQEVVEIMEAVGAFVITVAAGVEQELRNGGKMFVRTVGGEPCLHLFIQFEDCGAAVILPVEFAKRSDFLAGESLGTQDQGPFMAAAELFADMLDPGNAQIPVLFVEREAVQDFFFSQQFFDDAEGVVVIQQGTGLGNHSVLVQEPGTEAMDIADKQVLHLTVQPSADPLLHAA